MTFTNEERRILMIPSGWQEPQVVINYIRPITPMLAHLNRPGDKRPETRAYVFHGTGNLDHYANAKANGAYFRRPFHPGEYLDAKGYRVKGYIEVGSLGSGGLGKKFIIASTHCICDRRRVEVTIPYAERAYNCGDRRLPWSEKERGMPPLAVRLFGARDPVDGKMKPYPNSFTWSLEIAMNDELPNSSVDWDESCMTARWYAVRVALAHGDDLTKLPILRHHDVTEKECPSPFVGPASEEAAWIRLKAATIELYKFFRAV